MSPLKNAPAPELIPTYDGSDQSTHPSVVRFDRPWNGFLYWMAMTPYPNNNDGFEDPSVLASNDGKRWVVPAGVENPLVPAPLVGHNCDVELVYVREEDELRLYYVEADDVAQSWVKLLRSKDGAHWTGPETVIHDPARKYGILSPAIQTPATRGISVRKTRSGPACRKTASSGAKRPRRRFHSPVTRYGT